MAQFTKQRRKPGAGSEVLRRDGRCRKRGTYKGVQIEVTAKTMARARELFRLREIDIDNGTPAATRTTVGQWLERWLKEHEKTGYGATWYKYRSTVQNHVYPYALARKPLADVGPTEMVEHDNALAVAGASPAIRKYVRVLLTSAFKLAIERDLIIKNPYRGVRPVTSTIEHTDPLTDHQYAAFTRAIVGDRYEMLYWLAIVIGLRQAELFGLQCGDFNVFRNELQVVRQLRRKRGRGGDWEVLPLKNRSKSGAVQLPEALAVRLRAYLQQRNGSPTDFMFMAADGGLMNDNVFREQFQVFLAHHQIERFTFRALRTTAVVRSMEAGNDIFVTAGMVGHKDERTTALHYARFSQRLKAAGARRLNDAICANIPGLQLTSKGDVEGDSQNLRRAMPHGIRLS